MADTLFLVCNCYFAWEIILQNALYGTFAFIFTLTKGGTFGLCEPRHEKTVLCINAKTKAHISFVVTTQRISAFVFALQIEQFPISLHHTPTIASLLLSPMVVSDPRGHDFSRRGSCIAQIGSMDMRLHSKLTSFPSIQREARWLRGRAFDFGARSRGFDPHSGRRVVALSKIHLPPKKYS